jgi:hypothetical protein
MIPKNFKPVYSCPIKKILLCRLEEETRFIRLRFRSDPSGAAVRNKVAYSDILP